MVLAGKQRFFLLSTVFVVAFAWLIAGPAAYAAESIVIGVPTSLGFLEGKEAIVFPLYNTETNYFADRFAKNYQHLLINHGHEKTKNYPYAFAKFKDGQTITPIMRRLYFNLVYTEKAFKGSPFEQHKYFQTRLRSQKIIGSVRKACKYVIKQVRRCLKPDYYFDIP